MRERKKVRVKGCETGLSILYARKDVYCEVGRGGVKGCDKRVNQPSPHYLTAEPVRRLE